MRLALALLVVVLAAGTSSAQRGHGFAEKGDVALVAELASITSLQPLQGGIGLRYRLADQTVFGASVGGRSVSADEQAESDGNGQDRGQESSFLQASFWVEQHLGRPRRSVSPFVGAGLQLARGSDEMTYEQTVFPCRPTTECGPVTQVLESDRETRTVGGALFVGAEVRLARGVTLGGAYALSVTSIESDEQVFRDDGTQSIDDARERDEVRVETGISRVLLSVYF